MPWFSPGHQICPAAMFLTDAQPTQMVLIHPPSPMEMGISAATGHFCSSHTAASPHLRSKPVTRSRWSNDDQLQSIHPAIRPIQSHAESYLITEHIDFGFFVMSLFFTDRGRILTLVLSMSCLAVETSRAVDACG